MPFHNIIDFAQALFDIERGEPDQIKVTERASHRLFKHSPAGLGIAPLDAAGKYARTPNTPVWGVKVTGIVEGTDIECASDPLMFPFDAAAFWAACETVNESLDDAKADWDAQGEDE